jgi:hypothetical protein
MRYIVPADATQARSIAAKHEALAQEWDALEPAASEHSRRVAALYNKMAEVLDVHR